MNNHLTLLRFAVTQPDGSAPRLHSGWFNLLEGLNVLQRLQISARLKPGAEDVCELRWEPTISGERFSRSRLELGDRIKAQSPSLEGLLEAIQRNEEECANVRVRSATVTPLAVND